MTTKRKQYSNDFKFKIALEAAREVKTVSQLASEHNLHPTQIGTWKKQLVQQGNTLFTCPNDQQHREQQDKEASSVIRTDWPPEDGIGVAEKKAVSFD